MRQRRAMILKVQDIIIDLPAVELKDQLCWPCSKLVTDQAEFTMHGVPSFCVSWVSLWINLLSSHPSYQSSYEWNILYSSVPEYTNDVVLYYSQITWGWSTNRWYLKLGSMIYDLLWNVFWNEMFLEHVRIMCMLLHLKINKINL